MSKQSDVTLTPIACDGSTQVAVGARPELLSAVIDATVANYAREGFEPPWIGYVALHGVRPVGTCGFKSPPRDGRVELAYFTFPEFERRGIATAMAKALVELSVARAASIAVAAQTLPERNASHRVLEKLGFRHVATLEHPEDGTVWEWLAERPIAARPAR